MRHLPETTRRAAFAALLSVLIVTLSACGGGGGDGVEPAGASQTAGVDIDEADSGVETITGTINAQTLADVSPSPGGTLVLRIGGTTPGINHDILRVKGRATLGGTLVLSFDQAYTPTPGKKFTVIVASGGLRGGFATVRNNKNLNLITSQTATRYYVTVGS